MDEARIREANEALGDQPLERRIALILLHAAGAQPRMAQAALDLLGARMERVLSLIGLDLQPDLPLRASLRWLDDEELLDESVDLLGEFLPKQVLAALASEAADVATPDQFDVEGGGLIPQLVQAWQVDPLPPRSRSGARRPGGDESDPYEDDYEGYGDFGGYQESDDLEASGFQEETFEDDDEFAEDEAMGLSFEDDLDDDEDDEFSPRPAGGGRKRGGDEWGDPGGDDDGGAGGEWW